MWSARGPVLVLVLYGESVGSGWIILGLVAVAMNGREREQWVRNTPYGFRLLLGTMVKRVKNGLGGGNRV